MKQMKENKEIGWQDLKWYIKLPLVINWIYIIAFAIGFLVGFIEEIMLI